ncbi:MAG: UDP-N-acetylmuramoyl-L-alanyl-D-glutamate--2,6-diaminopimelate ligase [Chlorobiaceae bacterium]|nr:UDP-N-acetylmuramoyl-L-alanyl-D-glutamate--2,6-diaminopimelate ligase [Chlorobiaceae bacterium]MBA4309669.1 UDP-N-acetylmuramoyl-L-alanyl-D-glutamate--2,6-diaminopimelate ligase [Chlorobiaceae bacterium]
MELTQLLNSVKTISVTSEIQRKDIAGIYYDSRKVKSNSLFVAIKGFNSDGHKYILEAINKGAIAVVVQDNKAIPDEIFMHEKVAKILVQDSRQALAELSNAFYKDPSSKLKVIGITGTNGKTTTTYFVKTILETSGHKSGLLGTIANYIGDEKIESSMTTPESSDLFKILYDMLEAKTEYCVMEASSHSLELKRVYGLNFITGIFTNITSDHLDFHGNWENYLNAKKKLFDSLYSNAITILNADDPNVAAISADCKANKIFYGKNKISKYRIADISYDLNGTIFNLFVDDKKYSVSTRLIGEFNAYNATAAIAACVENGISIESAIEGVKATEHVPGRFEVIGSGDKKVIVDYAHTADSLEKALQNLRKIVGEEKPICTVFGCGGNRDKTKRPLMGKIATELSDIAIITNDNSRFEDPSEIIEDIKKGISKNNYRVIIDREEAIREAILNTDNGTVILVAGKGHENYQSIAGVNNYFSDKEVASKYLGSIE